MLCPHCQRTTQPGKTCEWCRKPLDPPAAKAPAGPAKAATVQEPEAVEAKVPPERSPGEPVTDSAGALALRPPWRERLADAGIDRDTIPILALILVHLVVSLIRGGFTLYSLPIVLWLAVAAGVVLRQSWSLALALALVCLEIAFALFGIAPHTVRGLPSWSPIDFVMILLRIITGFLILRIREQLD